MIQIAYCGSLRMQLCVSHDLFSDLRGGDDTNFLTIITYSSQLKTKLYLQKNKYAQNLPVELAQCWPRFLIYPAVPDGDPAVPYFFAYGISDRRKTS